MLTFLNGAQIGTLVYSCGTSLVRYLYVSSSLEVNIQKVMKRDTFLIKSIVIGECINFITLFINFLEPVPEKESGRSNQVLYRACLNPNKDHTFPLHKLMPWNHIIIILSLFINISCNLFLYRYLGNQTTKNQALSEVNKKKERKRNLVPAHLGIIVLFIGLCYLFVMLFTYTYQSPDFDSATRAFLNATFLDLVHCVLSPLIILYGSIPARRKLKEMLKL